MSAMLAAGLTASSAVAASMMRARLRSASARRLVSGASAEIGPATSICSE
jgi:hypothetical protein